MVPALPLVGIDVLLVVLWTIAAALAIAVIMNNLAAILAGVPWIGGKLSDAVKAMARAITHACGVLMGGIEQFVGAGLHLLARFIDLGLNQFLAHSALIAHLARIVGTAVYDVTGIRALVHGLSHAVHVVLHRFVVLARDVYHLGRRVGKLEREWAQGIGEDVLPRIRSLEREVGKIESQAIPTIRGIASEAEAEVSALQKWIAANVPAIGTDAFAGAVAIALAALGLGGLRCNGLLNSLKNRGCGLWSGLESLLGMFVDLFIITDLCDLIGPLETAFSAVAAPAIGELTAAIDSMPCVAGHQPPALAVPALALPPNPGVTLNLP